MLKAIKIRLYLTNKQQDDVNSLLGSYRFLYNQCLNYKKTKYETDKLNTSLSDLSHYFHQDLRNQYEWLKQHNTKVLKQSIINLEQAYKNFFKSNKGFPKFKSKHDEQKCRFPSEAVAKDTFKNNKLNLTKTFKDIKFECSHRDKNILFNKDKCKIKSVTITKTKSNKYYATILVDTNINKVVNKPINNSVGIDLGIKTLLTLSTSETIDNPKWITSNEKQLKKLHKQLSKKVKGSNNRNKTRLKLAKLHEKIKNRKLNFLHNISSKIINENQIIIIEDLNVSGMMKNHKLAKAIQQLGLYELRRQLEYKSKWYGRELVMVDRWFPSSKKCSVCGTIKSNLKLSDRIYHCDCCGLEIDRDYNASVNIENEGINIIGQRMSEYKLVDLPIMDDKEEIPLKSNVRLKQEDETYKIL
jgi:putative transposase